MKKAIYGGSFDPFHEGHKQVIKNILSKNLVDKIIVIPCRQNPLKSYKPTFQTPSQKLDYIRKQIKEFGDKCEVSTTELLKWSNEPSYTSVTLRDLMYDDFKRNFVNSHEYFVIIGVDEWNVFKQWKNYEWILNYSKVIVHPRPGIEPTWDHHKMIYLKDAECIDISSSQIRLDDFIEKLKKLNVGYNIEKKQKEDKFQKDCDDLIEMLKA